MGISNPTGILSLTTNVTNNTATATTTRAPPGSLILVFVGAWTTPNSVIGGTVSDSAGNTYTNVCQTPTTGNLNTWCFSWFACINSQFDLPSGGTITANVSPSQNFQIAACFVTGANGGLDVHPTQTNIAGITSFTLASGGLASSNEILFGGDNTDNGVVTGYADNAGWNQLFSPVIPFAWQIVTSAASVNWSPSWTGAATESAGLVSFKATPIVAIAGWAETECG